MNDMSAPVFIGGTGRSGTTILARLLGQHANYFMIPVEVRFVVDRGGLGDLVRGDTSLESFLRSLRRTWFRRDLRNGETRGLHKLMEFDVVETAIVSFRSDYLVDPWAAGGKLIRALLDPLAAEAGAESWVEMTPPNAVKTPDLQRLLPNARTITCVRDGRDVACSVVPLGWGPNDLDSALTWWDSEVRAGHHATLMSDQRRSLQIQMEDLVLHRREETYDAVLDFVGLSDDPKMRAFFDSSVTAERAHVGRWETEVPPVQRDSFHRKYVELVAKMHADGIPIRPVEDSTS
jgi:hypothetical protein